MKPIKFSTLIPEISKRVNQPVSVTQTVLNLYWNSVEKSLSTLAHSRIQIANLGTFKAKPTSVNKRLLKRESLLQRVCGSSTRQQSIRKETQDEIAKLENVLTIMENEKKRKRSLAKNKNLTDEQRKIVDHLGQPQTDF